MNFRRAIANPAGLAEARFFCPSFFCHSLRLIRTHQPRHRGHKQGSGKRAACRYAIGTTHCGESFRGELTSVLTGTACIKSAGNCLSNGNTS